MMKLVDHLLIMGEININSIGSQQYDVPVMLFGNTILQAGGNITFSSIINVLPEGSGPVTPPLPGYPYSLTLSAGGDINFNDLVGSGVYEEPLGMINILNAHNVNINSNFYTQSFIQQFGTGTTSIPGLLHVGSSLTGHGTGEATIRTNQVTGNIDVGKLYLEVNLADLWGYVGGSATEAALDNIILLNTISMGTHYFNMIDMYKKEKVMLELGDIIGDVMLDEDIIEYIIEEGTDNIVTIDDYLVNFIEESTTNDEEDDFDYMLLLEPMTCEVTET
jgi:hypothetical protein